MTPSLQNVYIAWIFISLGCLLFGYIIGLNSNIVTTGQLLCPERWHGEVGTWVSIGYQQCYIMSAWEQGAFSSLSLLGAAIASVVCYYCSDKIGRKLQVQIGAIFYVVGAASAAASPSLCGVCLGITVYGLGIGFCMHVAPIFIAEIAPATSRGRLVSATEAAVVLGIFLGFFSGFVFSGRAMYGWRFSFLASVPFALAMHIGTACITQSPRYLVLLALRNGGILGAQDGPLNDARESLKFYRQADTYVDVEDELQDIYDDCTELQWRAATDVQRVQRSRNTCRYPRPLAIACGMVVLQQITGQTSVLYFATDIFKDAGFGKWASLSSVGVGFVKLLATFYTVWQVDKFGRRALLFFGIGMMSVALAVLGTAFMFRECRTPGKTASDCHVTDLRLPYVWAIATTSMLMLYVAGYQVSFASITRLVISEIFPLQVRASALSLASVLNFASNIIVTLTQEVLLKAVTPSGTFFAYCSFSLLSLLFVYGAVPEAIGKSLEQVQNDMVASGAVRPRSFSLEPDWKRSITSMSTTDSLPF
jgi:sugar porter (SP) family MFS transporter